MPDAFALMGRVGVDTSPAEKGLSDLGQKVASFGQSFREGLNIGAGMAAFEGALTLLGEGFGKLKGSMIDFNQTIDGARASMGRFFDSQQSLNNSIAELNTLAARTPFAFEGLLKVQQMTIGAARNAGELRDNMDAIAVASANTGRVGTDNVERIGIALGQMQSKGHLAGGEMLQLTEAGVNMGEILSKHFGVSTEAIQKMVTEGKIGSQDVFAALRESAADPKNRTALDELAKTWEGAWSTIGDVGKTVIASTFRPMFDMLTEGAVAFASFIQTDQFKVWAEAVRVGFEGAVGGIKALLGSLAPVGETIKTAFAQLTSGDFSGAFTTLGAGFGSALSSIFETVTAFASRMLGAGENVVSEFASGMLSGAQGALQGAIDAIASLVASFFIGSSPPPAGPLARIAEGGTNTAAAWTGAFGTEMAKGTGQAVATTASTILGLKEAATGIAAQIRDITDQSQALDHVMRGLKGTIDDVKAGYAAQKAVVSEMAEAARDSYAVAIQGVRDQIDTIKDSHARAAEAVSKQIDGIKEHYANDIGAIKEVIDSIKTSYDAQETSVQRVIDQVKDRYAAAIDTLKNKIESVKESYGSQEAALQRAIDQVKEKWASALDGVRDKIASITDAETRQLGPLEAQLRTLERANTFLRERQDAETKIANAKAQQLMLDSLGDPVLRAQLAGQLAGITQQQQQVDLAQQLAEAQAKLAGGGLSSSEAQSLELKIKQLTIQKQLADMVDTTKLSEATRQASLLESQQKQLTVTRELEDANKKILEIPLEEKIARIKDVAEAALAPLQARLREMESSQKAALDPMEARLKSLKTAEADALVPLTTRLKGLESGQQTALGPLQDHLRALKAEEADLLVPLTGRLHSLEADQKRALDPLEQRLKDIKNDERDLLAPLVDRLQSLTKEADLWSRTFAAATKDIDRQQREALAPLEAQLRVYQGQKDALSDQRQELEAIKARIQETIQMQQQAAAAAKAAGGPAVPGAPAGGLHLDVDAAVAAAEEKVKAAGATLAAKLGEGFTKWFDENKVHLVEGIIGFFVGGALFGPIGALAGAAFLPAFLDKLQEKLAERGFSAQPFIDALAEGAKTGNYDRVVYQLVYGTSLAIQRLPWTIAKAVWAAMTGAVESDHEGASGAGHAVVQALIDSTKQAASLTLADLGAVARAIFVGVGNALREMTGEISKESEIIGTAIIDGIGSGLKKAFVGVGDALRWVTDGIVAGFKKLFGIASPSTVMAEIGEQLVDGLAKGVTDKWNAWKTWWTDLPGMIQAAFGWSGGTFTWVADLKASGAGVLQGIKDGVQHFWDTDLKTWLEGAGDWIVTAFNTYVGGPVKWLVGTGSDALQGLRDGVQTFWDGTLNPWLSGAGDWVVRSFRSYVGGPVLWLVQTGGDVLQGLKDGVQRFWDTTAKPWLEGAGSWVVGAFETYAGGPIKWLVDTGSKVLEGLKDGLFSWLQGDQESPLARWIRENLTDKLPTWVKTALGISSPSTVFQSIGQSLIDGLLTGMQDRFPAVSSFITRLNSALGGAGGGAVTGELRDWIDQAMRVENVDPGKWGHALAQLAMNESGGQADPAHNNDARGVMQTIPSTFEHYRDPSLPDEILNPIANIAAAIRYVQQEYETGHKTGYPIDINGIVAQWGVPGTFFEHGYAAGGIAWEPQIAHLAEREPEAVIPRSWFAQSGGAGGPGAGNLSITVNINGSVLASKRDIEEAVVQGVVSAVGRARLNPIILNGGR